MSVADTIRSKLTRRFAPARLEIEDQSRHHEGHLGERKHGETHFRVLIVAEAFSGLSRVQRQRLVYEALDEELKGPVHALAVRAVAPGER